jgi:alpha-galactosidase/6-phospho-beta-glucosidase family protein
VFLCPRPLGYYANHAQDRLHRSGQLWLYPQAGGYPARVTATEDRRGALEGADGVVCTMLQGGVQVWRHDSEELAVAGIVERDAHKIFHAVALDPLTAAVLSLKEIRSMVEEMLAANSDWLQTR